MSDERSTEPFPGPSAADHRAVRFDERPAELSASLRRLAESHQSVPTLAGSAVRRRAARRRQRRAAVTAGAGVTVLAAAAFVVTLPLHDSPAPPRPPAASATAPPPATSTTPRSPTTPRPPTGRIDVRRQALTLDEHVLPILSSHLPVRLADGPLTVAKRYESERTLISRQRGDGYTVSAYVVVELRDSEGERLHIGAKATTPDSWRGTDTDSAGWIGLDAAAAKWFHGTVEVGDELELAPRSRQPQPDNSATDRPEEAAR